VFFILLPEFIIIHNSNENSSPLTIHSADYYLRYLHLPHGYKQSVSMLCVFSQPSNSH